MAIIGNQSGYGPQQKSPSVNPKGGVNSDFAILFTLLIKNQVLISKSVYLAERALL
jgi:hypothetical protein